MYNGISRSAKLEGKMPKVYMGEIILELDRIRLRNESDYFLFGLYNSKYDTVLAINEFRKTLDRKIEKILVYEMSAFGVRNTVGTVDAETGVYTAIPKEIIIKKYGPYGENVQIGKINSKGNFQENDHRC